MNEAGEEARRKMEEMRVEGKELEEEAAQKTQQRTELGADKARETKESVTQR